MRLSLRIMLDGECLSVGYEDKIPEMFQMAFEPIRTSTDAIMSFIARDQSQEEVKMIMKCRDDAAEELSKHIARLLVMEMKKNDTHNGYK